MSSFNYYIPQQIKVNGNIYFFKQQLNFIGNSIAAKAEVNKLRKENPNKILRLCYGTISEYI